MSIGMKAIERINKEQERAKNLGFLFTEDPHSKVDVIALAVAQDKLPSFRDGAILFTGSLDEVSAFLNGVEWARWYDITLGLKTDMRRERAEQRLRNQNLISTLGYSNEK